MTPSIAKLSSLNGPDAVRFLINEFDNHHDLFNVDLNRPTDQLMCVIIALLAINRAIPERPKLYNDIFVTLVAREGYSSTEQRFRLAKEAVGKLYDS